MAEETYRTNDGRDYFRFSFEQQGSDIRIYITGAPSYGSRATDAHSTHRYSDGSRHYICWDPAPGKRLDTIADARKVAKAWAENTQQYIRTGKSF